MGTGLDNFGPNFLEPFTQYVESVVREFPLNPIGVMTFKANMQRMLVSRLRFEEDLRLHPEILDEDISGPVIILGLARTGSTKLQRMMAAAPQVQKLYFWRLLNAAPFPGTDPAGSDPRIDVAKQGMEMLQSMYPDLMAAHPMPAEDVDEESFLMEYSFESLMNYMMVPAPSYYQWLVERKMHDCYRYTARLMQYLQWQDGGRKGRPWIMKSPFHLGHLDALIEVFPDATLVYCHRDVAEVVPSLCNVMEQSWRTMTDKLDLHEVGRILFNSCVTEMNRSLKLRKELGSRIDIYDVPYAQIHADPMTVIREVYRRAGWPLTEDSIQAMQQWARNNPQNRFGTNTYTLERYGLTREAIAKEFREYIAQFGQYFTKRATYGA